MKTIPIALAAHYNTRQTTVATALRITRPDAVVYAFTSHDIDDVVSGVTYMSNPGLAVKAIEIAANATVGNLELTTLHDGTVFTEIDVLGGKWRNSTFVLFRYNWASISDGIETVLAGVLGEVELRQNTIVAELRDYRQYLQQPVGSNSSKTCRYRLGSTDKFNGGLCLKDISSPPFTMPGTVVSVVSNSRWEDTGRFEVYDFFSEGYVDWLTGDNATLRSKIFQSNGTDIVLSLPMFATIHVGDTYTIVVGCRKAREADCRDKFNNVLNFGGEPDRPGIDALTQTPNFTV